MTQELSIVNYNNQKELIKQSKYPEQTKQYMLMAVSSLFSDLTTPEKVSMITEEFEKALTRAGTSKLDDKEKGFTISEIIALLNKKKQVTHKEVSEIFRKGSLGLYGKYFGINVKSVHEWIESFYADEDRKIAIRKLNELNQAAEKIRELTPIESQSLIKKSIKEIFEERKINQFSGTELLSYPIYDFLKLNGFINLTDKEKEYLLEEAEAMLKSNLMAGAGYKKTEELIAQFNTGVIKSDKLAKVLAVRDFMNDLIESGKIIEL